ncbi:AAA family ATPase [Peptoniphilus equinus]|uniref:AAA family ATPase n=1 Tax=Peptoniphilus equinus TaxID=3016343 RepID=A0ABY7QT85_9FIRM|nr:AAA family ATPase [Peptoniphilus equinus]WBW49676.1 AAA family ATPase [Peptoniphilus equinus]
MIIKELNILGFGKFHDRHIMLQPGINIIRGDNESGKSTLYHVIEGMFYGFGKDQKRRAYTEDRARFSPWDGGAYQGSMVVEDGDLFHLWRDFDSGAIRFTNRDTGEDLSDEPELFTFSKVPQPGSYFFGVSRRVFSASAAIGQRQATVGDDGTEAIHKALLDFENQYDTYSPKDAALSVKGQLDALGSAKRKATPLGKLYSELDVVTAKKQELLLRQGEDETIVANYLELKKSVELQEDFVRTLKASNEQRDYDEIIHLQGQDNLGGGNFEDYLAIQKLQDQLQSIESKLAAEAAEHTGEVYFDREAYQTVERITSRLEELNAVNNSREIKILQEDLKGMSRELLILKLKMALGILISAAGIGLFLYRDNPFTLLLMAAGLLYFRQRWVAYRIKAKVPARLESRIKGYELTSLKKTKEKKAMDHELEALFEKYEVTELRELRDILGRQKLAYRDYMSKENYKTSYRDSLTEEGHRIRERLNALLETHHLTGAVDVEALQVAASAEAQYKHRQAMIATMLRGRKLEDLNHHIHIVEGDYESENRTLTELKLRLKGEQQGYLLAEKRQAMLKTLREEEGRIQEALNELQDRHTHLNEAYQALVTLSQGDANYIASLKEKAGAYFKAITEGKYSAIAMDNHLKVKVLDETSQRMVDVSDLSEGTADQLFLALRLGAADCLIQGAPLILDDHFITYDDRRLKATLNFLGTLNRQILIFTALDREEQLLNTPYYKVSL